MSQTLAERADVATHTTSPATLAAPTVAGLGFVSLAITQLVFPAQTNPFSRLTDYLIEYSYLIALWASVLAVIALHRAHHARPRWGRLGTIATTTYAIGHALVGTAVATTAIRGEDSLGLLFLPGILGWLIGAILLAIAAFRTRLLPRTLAVALGLSLPLTMAVGHAGPFIDGAIWLAITIALFRSARQP